MRIRRQVKDRALNRILFSKSQLLTFILVFGTIGGLMLLKGMATAPTVGRYSVYEITLPYSSASVSNVWEDVTATVTFTTPSRSFQTHGFYYEANTWKARIAPNELGTWNWSATVTGPNGTTNSSGSIDVIDTGQSGFVQPNQSNPHRLVTSDGKPYIPIGIDDCVSAGNSDGSINDSMAFDTTIGNSLDSYFSTFSSAGFNLFRLSLDNCAYKVWSVIGSPQNTYLEANGKWADQFVQKARQYNVRVWMDMFGFSVPYPNATSGSPEMNSVDRYLRYMVDRYGAYVDFWELMNETTASSAWKTEATSVIRAEDPYQHRISTSWEDQSNPSIEVISPHWYETESELASDQAAVSHINAQKSYNKPIIFGEQGNGTCNWDSRSAVRMRLRSWAALFDEGSFIFWQTGQTKNYCNGAANIYIGPQERAYIKVMQDFGKSLTADATITSSSTAVISLNSYALTSATKAWAYVTNYTDHTNPSVGGKLTMTSPVTGTAEFISAQDGSTLGKQAVSAGSVTLNLPTFTTDIAVRITNAPFTTPSDTTPPTVSITAPSGGSTASDNPVTISANASDNIAVASVRFKLDDYNIGTVTSNPYSISWSPVGIENGTHTITAVATDTSGNTALASITITVSNTSLSISSFSPTSGPVGTIVTVIGTRLELTNKIAFNQAGVVSYIVDSPTQLRTRVPASTQTGQFSINDGQALSPTAFTVTAGSATAPTITSFSPASGPIGTTVTITGTNMDATSIVQFNGGAATSFTINSSTQLTAPVPPGTSSGNISINLGQATSAQTFTVTSDTTAPSVPTNLAKTGSSTTSITVSWTASTDNVAVTGYDLYENGNSTGTTASTSSTFSGLACGTSYPLAVDAFDAAGNKSGQASISASTSACADTTPPTVSITAPVNGATVSGASVSITATAADNVGVAGVQFQLDGNNQGAEDTNGPYSTVWDTTSLSNGNHTITAVARDAAGNTTTSTAITVTVNNVTPPPPDITPPSVPTNLTKTGSSTTSITLSWNPSSDNVGGSGLGGYKLYRNGSFVSSITSLSYTDNNLGTGLSPATSYAYQVSAYDNATPTANESAKSTTLNVSTDSLPVTPPQPPPPSGGTTPPPVAIKGDCNGDGHVTIIDLSILLSHYGTNYPAADFDGSSIVNIIDLSILLSNYGR